MAGFWWVCKQSCFWQFALEKRLEKFEIENAKLPKSLKSNLLVPKALTSCMLHDNNWPIMYI